MGKNKFKDMEFEEFTPKGFDWRKEMAEEAIQILTGKLPYKVELTPQSASINGIYNFYASMTVLVNHAKSLYEVISRSGDCDMKEYNEAKFLQDFITLYKLHDKKHGVEKEVMCNGMTIDLEEFLKQKRNSEKK